MAPNPICHSSKIQPKCFPSFHFSMGSSSASDPSPSFITVAAKSPVTAERKQNLHLRKQLANPYVALAVAAVDPEHPNGPGLEHHNMSELQQHVAFFDRNNDGIVYPWETYQGFRAVGFGVLTSIFACFLINLVLSYRSQPSWIPSPLLSIHIKNIHRCKHGSDTESYDTEGRFEPSKFDAIYSKYALTHPDALTLEEISTMLQANRNLLDFIGWVASIAEWRLLFQIGKDEDGLLHKETVRGALDGSLFEQLEKNRASRTKEV